MPYTEDQYKKSNLSILSYDVVPRDSNGVINDGILYIEPVNWLYDNQTINNIITTNFSYFKFPANIIVPSTIDTSIDTSIDTIPQYVARYKAQPQYVATLLTNDMALNQVKQAISLGRFKFKDSTTITNDSLAEGSFSEIQFFKTIQGLPQVEPGRFTITNDITEAGRPINFKIQTTIKFNNQNNNRYIMRLIKYPGTGNASNIYTVIASTSTGDNTASQLNLLNSKLSSLQSKDIELSKDATAKANAVNDIKANRAMYGLDGNKWRNRVASATDAFNAAQSAQLANLQEINITKQQIANLKSSTPGSAYTIITAGDSRLASTESFNINYTIPVNELNENDVYAVEFLANNVPLAPELIEEQTYWDVTSL